MEWTESGLEITSNPLKPLHFLQEQHLVFYILRYDILIVIPQGILRYIYHVWYSNIILHSTDFINNLNMKYLIKILKCQKFNTSNERLKPGLETNIWLYEVENNDNA